MENSLNLISRKIIGCAIEVHKYFGPGLLESVYQNALCIELETSGLHFEKECHLPLIYKDKRNVGKLRIDLLIENQIIVELKSVDEIHDIHKAQLLTYLKLSNKKLGLLLNFNVTLMKNGIQRMIL